MRYYNHNMRKAQPRAPAIKLPARQTSRIALSARFAAMFILAACLAITLISTGCSRQKAAVVRQPISAQSFKLDTLVTITIYDSEDQSVIQAAFDEIDKLESVLSVGVPGSDPDRLAQNAGKDYIEVSEHTLYLLKRCYGFSGISGGAFDCTVGPLVSLWGIRDGSGHYPSDAEREEALSLVNYRDVKIREDNCVMLAREGMRVDFGGIAKGYIADKVKELLINKGIGSALIDLGGNIVLIGSKPDGADFRIGARDPKGGSEDYFAVFEISDRSLVSSGSYERSFIYEGREYHHIMDTKTGFPANNELSQVTVISESSTDGDGLTTAAFALGLNDGLRLINSFNDMEAVFVTKENKVYVTDGLAGKLNIVSNDYVYAGTAADISPGGGVGASAGAGSKAGVEAGADPAINEIDPTDLDPSTLPVSLLFFSDTQADPARGDYSGFGALLKGAVAKNKNYNIAIFGGDTINDGSDEAEWRRFKAGAGVTLSSMLTAAVPGNHDNDPLLAKQFFFPNTVPASPDEGFFYYLNIGPVHFTMLDSNIMGAANQRDIEWLEADLRKASEGEAKWRIVVMHHPMWPVSDVPKDAQRAETMRESFLPLMYANGVDLVLCGHQHVYARSAPIAAGAESGGIIQIMVASGEKASYSIGAGASAAMNTDSSATTSGSAAIAASAAVVANAPAPNYLVIKANKEILKITAYDENHKPVDTLVLTK